MVKNAKLPTLGAIPAPGPESPDSGSPGAGSNGAQEAVTPREAVAPQGADVAPSELVEIVKQHHEAVYRYAFRLSGCSHDAEDLTQQTFLVAREKIDQLRNAQATRAWLYTVLRNCFLKELRQPRAVLTANFGETLEDRTTAPVDCESLQLALARLPDEFRLPLLLFYFEDLSYRDIATALNVPVGTVMSRLARAKAHLRRYWFEDRAAERAGRRAIEPGILL